MSRTRLGALLLLLPLLVAAPLSGQSGDPLGAYYRAVSGYFGVSLDEVVTLSEWRLPPDEIPVVLFIARRASVTPDAVVAYRRRGAAWLEVSRRFGWGAEVFHLQLEPGTEGPLLAAPYRDFRSRPAARWSEVALDDQQVVALVNAKILAEHLGVPPGRILDARTRARDFPSTLRALMGQGEGGR